MSMLRFDPSQRAGVEQILASPLLAKYTSPLLHNPLTVTEFNYLLESYVNNTRGASHIHLPQELSRLRFMYRMSISNNGYPEKVLAIDGTTLGVMGAEGSTLGTLTSHSDPPSQLPPLELRNTFKASISDVFFDPANDLCTLMDDPTDFGEERGLGFGERERDSMFMAPEWPLEPAQPRFEIPAPPERFVFPEPSQFSLPWPVLMPEPRPQSSSLSELSPRIISIQRKQGSEMSGDD